MSELNATKKNKYAKHTITITLTEESAKILEKRKQKLGVDYESSINSLVCLFGRDNSVTRNIAHFCHDQVLEKNLQEQYCHNVDRDTILVKNDPILDHYRSIEGFWKGTNSYGILLNEMVSDQLPPLEDYLRRLKKKEQFVQMARNETAKQQRREQKRAKKLRLWDRIFEGPTGLDI